MSKIRGTADIVKRLADAQRRLSYAEAQAVFWRARIGELSAQLDSAPFPLAEGVTPHHHAGVRAEAPMWAGAPRFQEMAPASCRNPDYPGEGQLPWLFGRFYDRKRGKVIPVGMSVSRPEDPLTAEEFFRPPTQGR